MKRRRNINLIGDGEGGTARTHLIWMRTAPGTRMLYYSRRRQDGTWFRAGIPPRGWTWGDVKMATTFIGASLVLLALSIYVALTGGAY